MTDRVKNVALVAASITALALGGSAIAGAASGGDNNRARPLFRGTASSARRRDAVDREHGGAGQQGRPRKGQRRHDRTSRNATRTATPRTRRT